MIHRIVLSVAVALGAGVLLSTAVRDTFEAQCHQQVADLVFEEHYEGKPFHFSDFCRRVDGCRRQARRLAPLRSLLAGQVRKAHWIVN